MIDKPRILQIRGNLCECGCGGRGEDLHHCLFPRSKRFPELDDERNLVLVNHIEHIAGKFDVWEWRVKFWHIQIARYPDLLEWVNGLPPKLSGRAEELLRMVS